MTEQAKPCLSGCRPPYHSMMCDNEGIPKAEPAPAPTPEPASVTPASDQDVAAWFSEGYHGPTRSSAALIARIESDAKVIVELRERLDRAPADWQTVDRVKAENQRLRARLAEVSEAAKTLLKYNNGVGRRCSDPHLKALEAILAKGDK